MKTLPLLTKREWLAWGLLSALLFSAGGFFTISYLSEANYVSDYTLITMSITSTTQVLAWWFGYLSRAMLVASPASLQLVPGYRRAVLLNTLFLMIGLSTLIAMIFASVHVILPLIWLAALSQVSRSASTQRCIFAVGSWLWFFVLIGWQSFDLLPLASSAPLPSLTHGALLCGTAAILIGVIALSRLHRWVGTVCVLLYMAMTFSGFVLPGYSWVTEFHSPDFIVSPAYGVGMLVAGAALCGWSLQLLGGQRGERALDYFRRKTEERAALRALTEPGARVDWSSSTRRTYISNDSFRRALTNKNEAMRVLHFGFGAKLDWQSFATICTLASVLFLFMPLLPLVAKVPEFTTLVGFSPLIAFAGPAIIPYALLRTNREQCLLSLTPAWPSKNPLNRWLILFIAVRIVIAWTVCVAIMTAMNVLYAFPLANLMSTTVTASLCAILLFGYSLKRYHKIRLGQRFSSIPIMSQMTSFAVIGLVTYLFPPTETAIIVMTLVSICYAIYRTLKVVRGPAILPASRIAND